MKTKLLEIRDSGTTIPALAIQMVPDSEVEHRYLRVAGYPVGVDLGQPSVVLMHLVNHRASSDPYELGPCRTLPEAHLWIIEHFDQLNDGDVVDVQVILGETQTPKSPEIYPPTDYSSGLGRAH